MSRTFVAALAIGAVLGFGWAARAADETVATVGDKKITRAQLEDEVRAKLIEIENQRYDALREGLDGMVAQELLKREAAEPHAGAAGSTVVPEKQNGGARAVVFDSHASWPNLLTPETRYDRT